jgi:hypothetical protein
MSKQVLENLNNRCFGDASAAGIVDEQIDFDSFPGELQAVVNVGWRGF